MPVDVLHAPEGRVRVYQVEPVLVKCGRAVGKSTTVAARASLFEQMFRFGLPLGWTPVTDWVPNLALYEWATIVGNLLLRKGLNFGIGGMYLEYENTAAPGDPVAAPSLTRDPDEGVAYYNDLATSPNRDYLRVPLIAGTLNVSDPLKFPKGNAPTFFAQSSGVQGVHGKPFSDANNSTVFGGALVAFVDDGDFTRDLVLSRFYLPTNQQQVKLPTSQIGLEWELKLK